MGQQASEPARQLAAKNRMINLTFDQLDALMAQFFWPFVRIGACFMTAPIFGAKFVPARIRILLSLAVTVIVSPLAPNVPLPSPFSLPGVLITVQQIIIGVAIGFALQLVFDALALGGQMLSNSMGLGFAFNVDPLRGAGTPVLGQLYMLLVTLTFLALNGHLVLIEVLVNGFHTLPVGTSGLTQDTTWAVLEWGKQLFVGSLMVALPGMTALLVVNLAFGVMSRAAPTLNLFAVGFPITLVFGLAIVFAGLPAVQTGFVESMAAALNVVRVILGAQP
jgi:flagellar biosynthetic protein FliR